MIKQTNLFVHHGLLWWIFLACFWYILPLANVIGACQESQISSHCLPCIIGISQGKADLTLPREIPDGQIWRYGMGVPFQVAPTIAGLFCNIGCNGGHDFEMGTDVVLFDQLSEISSNNAIPIARSHEELNPRNGKPYIIAKYTMRGGFVPFGAKRTDGSAHPHAGTGFGICLAVGFRKDMSIKPWRDEDSFSCLNFYQFSYDGEKFRVNSMDQDSNFHLPGGWKFHSLGMVNAVASNDDLLFTMAGSKPDSGLMAGVVRFQRKEEKWQPVSFTPIAPNGSEPSLVRDQGETWLFSARDRKKRHYCLEIR